MRDIRFRAWDKDKEWMVYNVQDAYDGLPYSEGNTENIVDAYHWVSSFSSFFDSDEFALMQFTGVKDKNGAEIYEGDIIKFKNNYPWGDEYCIRKMEYSGNMFSPTGIIKWNYEDAEVIGNIYENKYLLEDK